MMERIPMERIPEPECDDFAILDEDWRTSWATEKKIKYATAWVGKHLDVFVKTFDRATEGLSGWSIFGWFTSMYHNEPNDPYSVGVYWIVDLHPGLVGYVGVAMEVCTSMPIVRSFARNPHGLLKVNGRTKGSIKHIPGAIKDAVQSIECIRREWREVRNFMADLAERTPDKPMDLLE